MKSAPVFGLLLTAVGLSGCHMNMHFGGKPVLKGSGPVKSETRSLTGYDKLGLDGNFVVDVKVGPAESLKIEAQENLVADIKTEVKDGFLRVKTDHQLESDKPILVTITTPKLIGLNGASGTDITLSGVNGPKFSTDISGGGKLSATGTADDLTISSSGGVDLKWTGFSSKKLTVAGSGGTSARLEGTADDAEFTFNGGCSFEGQKLKTKRALVDSSGGCSIIIEVTDELTVNASGGGSVRYIGSPKVNADVSGGVDVSKA